MTDSHDAEEQTARDSQVDNLVELIVANIDTLAIARSLPRTNGTDTFAQQVKDTLKEAFTMVIELAAMSRKPSKTSKSAEDGRNKNT